MLAPHRDVIALDLPGFGDSPPLTPRDTPRPRRLAQAVLGLLETLGIQPGAAHAAGCSLGGWVALEFAAAGHAATVTAIAPAGLWTRALRPKPPLARGLARLTGPLLSPAMRIRVIRRLALSGIVAHPDRVPPDAAAALIRAYATSPGFAAANRAMRSARLEGLDQIPVPVTLAWPDRDRLVARPRNCPATVRHLQLADCGHIPTWDDPPAVTAALLAGSERR